MEKINVAELLRNCLKGMELDCTICNGVKFIELDRSPNFPIVIRANNGYEFSLTKYGQVHNIDDAKCVIFPKGKTTGAIIFIVILCSFIIVHHIYKIKDELDDIKEKLNEISICQTKHYNHLYNLLYQIDGCIEDIEDKLKE